MGLVTSQPMGGGTRTALFAVREREGQRDRIDILDNAIVAKNPGLARAVEHEVRRLLKDEDLGPVEVRFGVCADAAEGFRFICKVENRPSDGEDGRPQWRWWSPLMETAEDFRNALEEGLRVRRDRLAARGRPGAA